MKEIKHNGVLYAVCDNFTDLREGAKWYGDVDCNLQAARMFYNTNHEFKPHAHIFRERVVCFTQEAIVLIQGHLVCTVYDKDDKIIEAFHLLPKGIAIFYTGGHNLKVMEENTVFYEIKHGKFATVDADKRLL